MINYKTIKISFVIAVLMTQILAPALVEASVIKKESPNPKQKELTISESPEGKLFHLTKSVKRPSKVVMTVLTAYTSTPGQTDDSPFIAASGKRVYDGMVAANWLPMGTKIKIPALYGDKVFTVDDRMNPRYGYGRMDVWLDAPVVQAKKFGVKRTAVEIYYEEKSTKVAKVDSI
ncbi:MAG: hypothetical protein ACD_72C00202G0001 [uncultured bacterium]|nr:MAG: hypothetical protein ACD_72C00202G0001 [uncultured bacterium]